MYYIWRYYCYIRKHARASTNMPFHSKYDAQNLGDADIVMEKEVENDSLNEHRRSRSDISRCVNKESYRTTITKFLAGLTEQS